MATHMYAHTYNLNICIHECAILIYIYFTHELREYVTSKRFPTDLCN